MRATTLPVLLAAVCLLGAASRADAQMGGTTPMQRATPAPQTQADTAKPALPWSSLSAEQQRMLAPVRNQWNQLHPARQQRLAAHARHWASLPPMHQRQIQKRLARWAAMSPAQRHQLRENARVFHNLTPDERARVSEAFKKFQALPPEQQHELRQRWHAMTPNERLRWATEHSGQPIRMHPPRSSGG